MELDTSCRNRYLWIGLIPFSLFDRDYEEIGEDFVDSALSEMFAQLHFYIVEQVVLILVIDLIWSISSYLILLTTNVLI